MTGLEKESGNENIKTREELLEEYFEAGIPVTENEDEDTIKMFLGSADDDDYFDDEDEEEDEFEDEFDDDVEEPAEDDEIFDEDFDFDEDDDDDLFDDDDPQQN